MDINDPLIRDCQISSSPSFIDNKMALNARKGDTGGWEPGIKEGQKKFLQVNFGNLTKVMQILLTTADAAKAPSFVYTMTSNNGRIWDMGEQVSIVE